MGFSAISRFDSWTLVILDRAFSRTGDLVKLASLLEEAETFFAAHAASR